MDSVSLEAEVTPAEAERLIEAGRSGPDFLTKAIGRVPMKPLRLPYAPRLTPLDDQIDAIEAMCNPLGCVWRNPKGKP